ncbi:MAG: insulinase family protein [Chitinophagaceae bacterium]|nr:MAG: insulinase family protein [Chitinophagaceae bacterium]
MNRKHAPEIKNAVDFNLKLKPYEYFELDNGIPVYAVDAGAQDVVQLEMVFYAGNQFEERTGTASATNFLLKNGTRSRTAFQINEDFDYYGAYCSRACYNETAVVSLHSLTRHLPKVLPVLKDMLTESVFPESELDIYKQNSQQKLKVNLLKCEFVAGRMINSYLYGASHPYGRATQMEDIEKISIEEIRNFYSQYYLSGTCAIFIAGKLPSETRKMLNEHFGSLGAGKPSFISANIPLSPAAEKKYRITNDEAAVQGAIRIASHFPNRHHPDFKKAVVLNTIFGGFFGSRLMANIREEKGYTYGIYSYLQNHISTSAWVVSTEAGKDVCEPAIAEVYKEMQTLRETPVDADELLLVQNYLLGTVLGDLDGPFQIIAKWKNIILNNLDESYFYDSMEAIRKVDPKELQQLANTYLQPEKFYELVVY